MGLQRFERRLERLVEGAFAKAFRSGLQPVEIGRRLVRELDAGRTLGVRGTVAPNRFTILLSQEDTDRFTGFQDALARELAESVREHARDEGYYFTGPVEVVLDVDEHRKRGDLKVVAEFVEGEGGIVGSLVLPDGRRVQLGDTPAMIGRLPDCAVALSDAQVSRHHAEIRPENNGYRVIDLGSTNGTLVNGARVASHDLRDGDVIVIGNTSIMYEES
ncbi:MAG: FhaA domain-containing protein [Actinomycetota bacterium]